MYKIEKKDINVNVDLKDFEKLKQWNVFKLKNASKVVVGDKVVIFKSEKEVIMTQDVLYKYISQMVIKKDSYFYQAILSILRNRGRGNTT